MIKALVFDCFGVLYPDTYWTIAKKYLGSDFSGKKTELHDLVTKVDLGYITRDELWSQFSKIIGKTKQSVYQELQEMGGLDQQLLDFIEEKKADYKIAMISNVGQGFLESMFDKKPAKHYFDAIILSSDVGLVKPDKRIYELCAQRLEIPIEECVFTDDLEKNTKGAVDAGMQAIKYGSFEQYQKQLQKLIARDSNN